MRRGDEKVLVGCARAVRVREVKHHGPQNRHPSDLRCAVCVRHVLPQLLAQAQHRRERGLRFGAKRPHFVGAARGPALVLGEARVAHAVEPEERAENAELEPALDELHKGGVVDVPAVEALLGEVFFAALGGWGSSGVLLRRLLRRALAAVRARAKLTPMSVVHRKMPDMAMFCAMKICCCSDVQFEKMSPDQTAPPSAWLPIHALRDSVRPLATPAWARPSKKVRAFSRG